jgi:RNA polymerase sigma factor (sigma-70 family)
MAQASGDSLALSSQIPRVARDEVRSVGRDEVRRVPGEEVGWVVAHRFGETFEQLFESEYPRLFRYLDRLSGEPDLAADLAQEAFIRLYRRGAMPDRPAVWLATVALNLFRNARTTAGRRKRLLTLWQNRGVGSSNAFISEDLDAPSTRVRQAMNQLTSRDRELLVLRAEGYSYREIASALQLNEGSVGTLLARARQAFRRAYGSPDASG